ncbi:MAG: efflux RND transporter periplasmic adaptor subunit [Oscillospiraceae bacterium]|nr:efflux RND transporter periplasmic adaptor subunit [Oscillospiraceae bacterium]
MTDESVKRRGWIKNIAIIFLAVLLVLTFFSNTIMNRSLPEVAAQYAASGSISEQIRGTGTVTPNESYEVKLSQTRTVESVVVRVGDEVLAGDTLAYLSLGDSDELETAREELEALELAYQKALLSASGSDYSRENRNIENAREALAEAEAEAEELYADSAAVDAAQLAVDEAEAWVDECEEKVETAQAELDSAQITLDKAQTALDELGGKTEGYSGDYSIVTAAKNALTDAKNALSAVELMYDAAYTAMQDYAEANRGSSTKDVYMRYLYNYWQTNKTSPDETAVSSEEFETWCEAYAAIAAAEEEVSEAESTYNSAQENYDDQYVESNTAEWNRLNKRLTSAKTSYNNRSAALTAANTSLTKAQNSLTDAKTELSERESELAEYKTALSAVKAARATLEDLIFDLSEQQETDGLNSQLANLDLAAQRSQIARKEADIAEMEAEGDELTLTSPVNGVVTAISATAGDSVAPDTAVITVEVPDRGYSVSYSVTGEQARRVTVGDSGTVSTSYWSSDQISAVLRSVATDPQNPSNSRLLYFDVSGDVTSGSSLTVSIGQKSRSYDVIVPNSAVRSDTNGSFVLIVSAKSSPLGNRYFAERVDVEVLASDDTSSAVSGGVTSSDFVITTSDTPVTAGMQVRLAD